MAKKKVSKKKVARKTPMKKKSCDMKWEGGKCLAKLSAVAFAFFLMTVWPKFNGLIMRVHWGWWLGAWLIIGMIAMGIHCKK